MEAWVFIVILAMLAVGIGAGFTIGRSTNSAQRRSEALESEISELREQMSDYKRQVGQHFAQTAEVVNAMTANYRALYDHLSKGAQDLCGEQFSSTMLDASAMRFIEHHSEEAGASGGGDGEEPAGAGHAGGEAAGAAPESGTGATGEQPSAGEGREREPHSSITDAMEKSAQEARTAEAGHGNGAAEEQAAAAPQGDVRLAEAGERDDAPHPAAEQAASGNGELDGGMEEEGEAPRGPRQGGIQVSLKEGTRTDGAEQAEARSDAGDGEDEQSLETSKAAHAPSDGKETRADASTLH